MARRSGVGYGVLNDAEYDVHQVVLTLLQLLDHLIATVQVIGVASQQLVHVDHVPGYLTITVVE